ncbi:Hypothetical protein PBC10988_6920 [Planctomycetales bacterium 10988]|nr:Hypothetical protein PBC10988_6920 [Planctomycetales bacterium 10988]
MSFSRGLSESDRRRRMLVERNQGKSTEPSRAERPPKKKKTVAKKTQPQPVSVEESKLMEQVPRISDLVPKRSLTFFLLFFFGVLVIAGLEVLYWMMPRWTPYTTDGTIAAFDLDGEGSLAVWYSSLLLTLCSVASLAIYAIRKRQVDDYRARYRIWFWAALVWLMMSIDETASLHEGFKEMMSLKAGTRIFGDGSMWWIMAYLAILLPLGLFIWLDMKRSKMAKLLLLLTAISYATAVVAQLEVIPQLSISQGIMIEEGCEMLGNLSLFLGFLLHARFLMDTFEPKTVESDSKSESATAPKRKKTKRKKSTKRKTSKRSTSSSSNSENDEKETTSTTKPAARKKTARKKATTNSDRIEDSQEFILPEERIKKESQEEFAKPEPEVKASSDSNESEDSSEDSEQQPRKSKRQRRKERRRRGN